MNGPNSGCPEEFSNEDVHRLASQLIAVKARRASAQQCSDAKSSHSFHQANRHPGLPEPPSSLYHPPLPYNDSLSSALDSSNLEDRASSGDVAATDSTLFKYNCSTFGSNDYLLEPNHLEDQAVSCERLPDRFKEMPLPSSSSNYSILDREELFPFNTKGNLAPLPANNDSNHLVSNYKIGDEPLNTSSLNTYTNITLSSNCSYNGYQEKQSHRKAYQCNQIGSQNSCSDEYRHRESLNSPIAAASLTQNLQDVLRNGQTRLPHDLNGFCMEDKLKPHVSLHEECIHSQENLDRYGMSTKYPCDYCYERVYALATKIANGSCITKTEKQDTFSIPTQENGIASLCGPGITKAVRGRTSSFQITFRNGISTPNSSLADNLEVIIVDPSGYPCASNVRPLSGGRFSVRYKPGFLGTYRATITFRGQDIDGSPCTIQVGTHHKYQFNGQVKGILGENSDELCSLKEPWGICCNSEGYIFIGDRGNNVVKVFKPNMAYSHSIGRLGSKPGELRKPAGVAINSQGEIIVADKDNHRIQVFDIKGKVTLWFGEKGSDDWQLHYPWDVAIAPQDAILVSDCRNARISMFTADGCFLQTFGAKDNLLKYPRGICFRESDKRIITTDMDKHQLIVINVSSEDSASDSTFVITPRDHPSLIGKKGSDPDELHRPQGVTCDEEGNVIVSDSRNQRVQVFDADGSYLHHWSIECHESGKAAQPRGVAVSPAGDVLVVDAANDRVIVY